MSELNQQLELDLDQFNRRKNLEFLIPREGRIYHSRERIRNYTRHLEHSSRYCSPRNYDRLIKFLDREYEKIVLGFLESLITRNLQAENDDMKFFDDKISFTLEEKVPEMQTSTNAYFNIETHAADSATYVVGTTGSENVGIYYPMGNAVYSATSASSVIRSGSSSSIGTPIQIIDEVSPIPRPEEVEWAIERAALAERVDESPPVEQVNRIEFLELPTSNPVPNEPINSEGEI